jgi:hypothetical protein
MNKNKLIWGIICLLIAGALTTANLRLPPEKLMFMVGEINMPWVPPFVLAVVGIILLGTMFQPEPEKDADEIILDPEKTALNKKLETIAWGVFLILLGCFLFIPQEIIRGGWWSISIGLIFLGLNLARFLSGLRMSGFTTFLGIIAVASGILDLIGFSSVNGAVLFIVLGLYLVLKPYFDQRQLFGKPDQA